MQVVEAQPTLGGGARTAADPEFPGVEHDICSAVHPLALASPFFAEFDLPARGVRLAVPDIAYANPLPDRPAAIAYRDLERTCAELADGASWRRLLGPLVTDWHAVVGLLLGDKRSVPGSLPSRAAPGTADAGPGHAGVGVAGRRGRSRLVHRRCRPCDFADAVHDGGRCRVDAGDAGPFGRLADTGRRQPGDHRRADSPTCARTAAKLTAGVEITEPPTGVVAFDTAPTALLRIYGDALPDRYAKALRRYRFGPGVAKVDFVLSDEIPWSDPRLRLAPTLHLGGSREQMALAEKEIAAGRHARWPMVLAAAPHIADPGRIDSQGRRPFWTYAHVPSGSTLDATEAVTAIIERFAPGFRDVVVAARAVPAAHMADHNANYVGGDIGMGGNSTWRAIAGPTPRLNPWRTPIPKAYLCSAATPPGGGVHGMAGYFAARTLLRREFGIATLPDLGPAKGA